MLRKERILKLRAKPLLQVRAPLLKILCNTYSYVFSPSRELPRCCHGSLFIKRLPPNSSYYFFLILSDIMLI